MKKVYLLLLIFIVFSCKSTPKNKFTDDPGLSQLDLTKEDDQDAADAGFPDEPSDEPSSDEPSSDEPSSDEPSVDVMSAAEDASAQDGKTDEIAKTSETKIDNLQADARNKEQQTAVEPVEEKKEPPEDKTPSAKEEKPPAPPAKPVQSPPVVNKEVPPVAETKAAEPPAEDKKDIAKSDDEPPQTPPPRYQPWIAPPPAVSAVKEDAPVPNQQALVPQKEEKVFSRTVRATVGQFVEIPFRGNNWSYLEDIISRRGIVYNSRRNDPEGMIFTFRAEETGIYALRFYRHDYIRDYILYDYVQVIVEEPSNKGGAVLVNPSVDRGKVTAEPRWPSALEEAAMLRGGARPASQTQGTAPQGASSNRETPAQGTPATPPVTAPQVATPQVVTPSAAAPEKQTAEGTPSAGTPQAEKQEKLPPEEILKKAQDAFNAGKTPEAIALLDQYTEYYPGGNDELYWLYGQFYEANTPQRNILLSLDYYRRLVDEYPQSTRYNDARRRIAYLERFYVNIQ